jgi:hypothetical protein
MSSLSSNCESTDANRSCASSHEQLFDLITDMITECYSASSPTWNVRLPGDSTSVSRGEWAMQIIQAGIHPLRFQDTTASDEDYQSELSESSIETASDDDFDEYEPYDNEVCEAHERIPRVFSVSPISFSGTVLYPGGSFSISEAQDCNICTDEVYTGSLIFPLSCGHIFHVDCLSEWVCHKPTCPTCRLSLSVLTISTVN